ncbi:MAG: response regulator transcription factor, partial [Casimicrobium sp.]
ASDRLLTEPPPPLNLTPRQMQVLALLVKGLCNKSICRQLSLSENTVKSHITAIFRSLGVNSRTSVVIAISERGYHLPKI